MELIEAIYHRRAVHDYTDVSVAAQQIKDLIDAAVQAPSSLNQQPWVFTVVQGIERLKGYSDRAKAHFLAAELPAFGFHERGDSLTDSDFNIFYNAGTLVVIYAKSSKTNSNEDCCMAAQTFMLAAHGAGLGTCPIGVARSWLNLPEIKTEMGIPFDLTAVFPMVLGHPAASPRLTSRKTAEIVNLRE